MGATQAHRSILQIFNALALVLAALVLAGCAGGPVQGFLSGAASSQKQPITLAPIIGAPKNISQSLTSELNSAAKQRNVPVVSSASAVYTLRGYLATSPEGSGHKLAYIWDVTDKSGKRVHRILGEHLVQKKGSDPWAGVDKPAIRAIAVKTMSDLASWLPKQGSSSTPPPAGRPVAATPRRADTNTSSTGRGGYFARVPDVTGAPGDGRKTLTLAIKKQLAKKGIKLKSSKGDKVYTVAGKVTMGRPSGKTQSIEIEWQVSDPSGKSIGKVSQKNTIAKGSLNKTWGTHADAAAAAAADGIIKLLPRSRR